jgi:hypothetical protein
MKTSASKTLADSNTRAASERGKGGISLHPPKTFSNYSSGIAQQQEKINSGIQSHQTNAEPIQRNAALGAVRSILKEKGVVQKKSSGVAQRAVNAISLGNPYTFTITKADLGTGTKTSAGTRNYVNNVGTAKPANVDWAAITWNAMFVQQTNNQGTVNNPVPAGNYDAGHALARQNGGLGNNNAWVFPQNPDVNQGHAGRHADWRAHEQQFHNDVNTHGAGVWAVVTR